MPSKTNSGVGGAMPQGKVSIKYVKRARMWCKTWFEYDQHGRATQKQEWYSEKPKE